MCILFIYHLYGGGCKLTGSCLCSLTSPHLPILQFRLHLANKTACTTLALWKDSYSLGWMQLCCWTKKISPSIWSTLEEMNPWFVNLKYCIMVTSHISICSNNNENKPAFCDIGHKLLSCITVIALLFFINQWSNHSGHKDYKVILQVKMMIYKPSRT